MLDTNKFAAFAVDCNVDIKIVSPQKIVRQTVHKHNKASKLLVTGMLRFIQGHFNTSYRRPNENFILHPEEAQKYIPCYVGLGTGGVILDSEGFPTHEPEQTRIPRLSEDWTSSNNFVNYSDTRLRSEMSRSVSRVEIGYVPGETHEETAVVGDGDQFTLQVEIPPGHYNKIYKGVTSSIYCTELGLFSGPVPNGDDLLARVIIKEPENVLYIRPQDTVILKWTISIIALGDSSEYTNPISSESIPVDSSMVSTIPLIIEE